MDAAAGAPGTGEQSDRENHSAGFITPECLSETGSISCKGALEADFTDFPDMQIRVQPIRTNPACPEKTVVRK
ncbi:MAG: hypothetical protein CMI00_00435 [Oceanospirillaceae bacterium]|nr:hypothetical protein [Oceanospirillaceae bacterium]|tara:strand:- start:119 stop:337 length:219 start_codon:yes stop_codon:yes gene_type:complete